MARAVADSKKGVQKGFLKNTRVSKCGSDMQIDEKDYFAFVGFPRDNSLAACNFISEQCTIYLQDFNLKVLGYAQYSQNDSVVCAVGIEFLASQRDALEAAVFQLRDQLRFQDIQLSTGVGMSHPEVFVWPATVAAISTGPWLLPEPLPVAAAHDPLLSTNIAVDHLPDPWRAYIGTPHATRRSSGARSGLSPLLNQNRQSLEAFLADTTAPALPPIAPTPAPQQHDGPDAILQALLQGQNALLQGVNEMRANMVTTQTLAKFHELQSREMQTYVQAELVPIHNGFSQVVARVAALEAQDRGSSSAGPMSSRMNPNDPGLKRLTFRGMDDKANPHDRIDAIERFMREHFPRVKLMVVENHYKSDFRNKKHELSKAAFVEFASPVVREQVYEVVKANEAGSHKFVFNGKDVWIARGLTENAVARNGVLKAADRALKEDGRYQANTVKIVWDSRMVTVEGVGAYKQGDRDLGQFIAPFEHMSLPARKR